jgi:hypothetical protein
MKTLISTNNSGRSKARSNYNAVGLQRRDTKRIDNCLGIAWAVEDVATKEITILGTKIPFEGDSNKDWNWYPSLDKPVQGKTWKHFDAPKGRKLRYWSIPMCGTPGDLKPRFDLIQVTNTVKCEMQCGKFFKFCPTNGYLSTQWLARQVPMVEHQGKLEYDFVSLIKMINDPVSGIRQQLCGGVPELLTAGIDRAKTEGGRVYLWIYELSDPFLLKKILDNAKYITIILSNTGPDDATNKKARQLLHQAEARGLKIIDRMLPPDEIGHCKVVIYVDATGKALFILGGSTNWTATGLCCQTNGAIEVDIPEIAEQGLAYWHAVEADCARVPMQNSILRELNAVAKEEVEVDDNGHKITVRMWNAPNMKERTKPKQNAPTPPDMKEIFGYIDKMKEHAGFLLFMPGTPSILNKLLPLAQSTDKIIRGAVSSAQALPQPGGPHPRAADSVSETHLIHRAGEPPAVVVASAIQQAFANFLAEILKLPNAHAIIHSKILVIDALAEDPNDIVVVITSHNLGFKASYQNDETTFIIKGCRALALAILVQIYDTYDHYRFRYAIEKHADGPDKVSGFLSGEDTWQDKYLSGVGLKELEYLTRDTELDEYQEPTDVDLQALQTAVAHPVLAQKNVIPLVLPIQAAKRAA